MSVTLTLTDEQIAQLQPQICTAPNPNPPDPNPPDPPVPTTGIPVPWGQGFVYYTPQHGGITCEDILVFSLVAGTSGSGSAVVSEYQGPAITRLWAISLTPGDIDNPVEIAGGSTATLYFKAPNGTGPGATLTPGTVYYFNMKTVGCIPGSAVNVLANFQFTA